MNTTVQAILGAAGVIVAVGVIYQKGLLPGARWIIWGSSLRGSMDRLTRAVETLSQRKIGRAHV